MSRLRGGFKEISKITSKPLILVDKIPVMQHLIKYLCRFGVKKVLLICCHKYDQFKKSFIIKQFMVLK